MHLDCPSCICLDLAEQLEHGTQRCSGLPCHTTTVIAVLWVFTLWSSCCCAFRTGQCREQQAGKCSLVHDPTAVAVCPRWLQGCCSNAACLLQHCRCPDVMPVCTFYLQVSHNTRGMVAAPVAPQPSLCFPLPQLPLISASTSCFPQNPSKHVFCDVAQQLVYGMHSCKPATLAHPSKSVLDSRS